MQIKVNGILYDFDDNISLENIINQLNISSNNIIAEVNGEVIIKDKFSETIIEHNAVIEIVKFVGGG
ncbi:sulfur carrier protein ThiS [Mucispirillum schaedleri]|uniref:sulfur carrier protein ThiS n=1 Tax=Mucispirillum schaedleri TaxID=248039 RepID=UPI001F58787A|nr:sulfur carrier protein ThiS [Mucispirillum schaedleri]